jgi:hypothetical protein
MNLQSPSQTEPNPYATERYFVDQHTFVEIEFYKDGDAHRVWPYVGHARVEVQYRGAKMVSDGKEHFRVSGAFETQAAARDAARTAAATHLIDYRINHHLATWAR